jgi:hypothetical protein
VDITDKVKQRHAGAAGGDVEWSTIDGRLAAWEWISGGMDLSDSQCQPISFELCGAAVAGWAAFAGDVFGELLLFASHHGLADVALCCAGFEQLRVDGDALVEYEAFAFVVFAANFFEVFQDATIKLVDLFEPSLFHPWSGLLTANSAGAEHDDGFIPH